MFVPLCVGFLNKCDRRAVRYKIKPRKAVEFSQATFVISPNGNVSYRLHLNGYTVPCRWRDEVEINIFFSAATDTDSLPPRLAKNQVNKNFEIELVQIFDDRNKSFLQSQKSLPRYFNMGLKSTIDFV